MDEPENLECTTTLLPADGDHPVFTWPDDMSWRSMSHSHDEARAIMQLTAQIQFKALWSEARDSFTMTIHRLNDGGNPLMALKRSSDTEKANMVMMVRNRLLRGRCRS